MLSAHSQSWETSLSHQLSKSSLYLFGHHLPPLISWAFAPWDVFLAFRKWSCLHCRSPSSQRTGTHVSEFSVWSLRTYTYLNICSLVMMPHDLLACPLAWSLLVCVSFKSFTSSHRSLMVILLQHWWKGWFHMIYTEYVPVFRREGGTSPYKPSFARQDPEVQGE